jgi:hypothetical protein
VRCFAEVPRFGMAGRDVLVRGVDVAVEVALDGRGDRGDYAVVAMLASGSIFQMKRIKARPMSCPAPVACALRLPGHWSPSAAGMTSSWWWRRAIAVV